MRILYLTQFFSSTRGGGPLIFYDLAKSISEMGHEVYVICNVATEILDSKNIHIITVKPTLGETFELPPSPIRNVRYIANSLVTGSRIIRRKKIDLIHTNSFTPVIAGSLLSKLMRIPMIASIYDVFTDADKNNWSNWTKQNNLPGFYSVLGELYEKLSLRMPTNLIHTISYSTKADLLRQKVNRPIRVIYPAINITTHKDSTINYDDFILYIGRLVFYKNVDLLIRSFQDVVMKFPEAKLIIAGEGPMEGEWRALARSLGIINNIKFMGHISHEDKINLLSKCSSLALPSLFEGFGLVILEAFAMCKPVIVSKVAPFDEIVDEGVNGFLLSHDDSRQWSQAIVALLSDKRLCQQLGNNGAQKLRSRYDFLKYIQDMEFMYLEMLRVSRNGSE
jgi:glycosyltransferase involved in cell wall biosynthesis